MSHRLAMAAGLAGLLFVACGSSDDDDDTSADGGADGVGNIEGYVVLQGQTDHSGADVTLDGTDQDAVSSETGLYAFAEVPAGTYTVTASLAGYDEVTSSPFEVVDGQIANVPPLTLETAIGGLEGFVLLDGADDHSGTVVEVQETSHTTTTNADGAWSIAEVEAGQYTVAASHGGYLPAEDNDVSVLAGQVTTVPPIELTEAVWLGYYEINNQEDLDALIGYVEVTGPLTITSSTDLVDLQGLESLIQVGGALSITSNSAIEALDGLDNLESVGNLDVAGNDVLTDLTALSNLTSTEAGLYVHDNATLTSLAGLSGITSTTVLGITENALLPSLDGLENLTTIPEEASISSNPELVSLGGLHGITDCNGIVMIQSNAALPYCEICDLLDAAPCFTSVDELQVVGNLADTCWTGSTLNCP